MILTTILATVVLLQFSDLHGDVENLRRIVAFRDTSSIMIDDAIHCGDAVICYYDNLNPWDKVKGAEKIINVVGNHDCWKGHKVWAESNRPYDATAEDAYRKIMVGRKKCRPFIRNWGVVQDGRHSCYFHKDYKDAALRLIVLDCVHYDDAQDAWFRKTLADAAAEGKAVVAVSHYQPQSGLTKVECGFSSNLEEVSPIPDPGEAQMERMPEKAFEAIDGFIAEGGVFACWLSGHTHLDMIGYVTGHERQFMITVDKAGEKDIYMKEDRTRGTAFQDSFNIISIDTANKKVNVRRIGCDIDEEGRAKKGFSYDYSTGEVSLEVPSL